MHRKRLPELYRSGKVPSMELATLYARHGQPGLEKLAALMDAREKAAGNAGGVKVDYLQRLLYVLERRPSANRAALLIECSKKLFGAKEALTIEGLTNPIPYLEAIATAMEEGKAHPSHVLRHAQRARPDSKAA